MSGRSAIPMLSQPDCATAGQRGDERDRDLPCRARAHKSGSLEKGRGGPSDAAQRRAGRQDRHAARRALLGRRAPTRSAEMTPSFDDGLAMPRGCDRLG